ncbi:hypothetical protein [Algoriphagus mannitolivorans]|uniref:hypothetical protein n=1 Tax=Algoriphagus mannitolivorans TaxID=226504 RepID=UPI000410CDEA|nr:hypothetical protein [Algoriphagus mannitolivorans]
MEKRILLKSKAQWIQDDQWVIRNRLVPFSESLEIQIQEITLGPETEILLSSGDDRIEMILPLLGEVVLEQTDAVRYGNLWTRLFSKKDSLSVKNATPTDSIHILRVCLPHELNNDFLAPLELEDFEGDIRKVWESPSHSTGIKVYSLFLSKFKEKQSAEFKAESSILAMPHAGVFEFQDILLDQGDCLQVFKPGSMKIKCLAPEGQILILEVHEAA